MKFVDEAVITVEAGKGGNGACSFLRLKFMPFGGPDGGNGGDGGSIFLTADESINTLVDYRYMRTHQAQNGEKGAGRDCTGRSGNDLFLRVPVGTIIYDEETGERIADLAAPNASACVAKGGRHGVGNSNFKSSVNRSPRRTIPGEDGEKRLLRLELKVLADVGLVGLPNAGKSTLVTAISAARPKIADYPFTTLYPSLGMVSVSRYRSFVVADLPGLIEGAADGAGLGTRFLKHVARTRLLFHVVDICPVDGSDPANNIVTIQQELANYSPDLLNKTCWLVFNKLDLLPADEAYARCAAILAAINWQGRSFKISGAAQQGLTELTQAAMNFLEDDAEE